MKRLQAYIRYLSLIVMIVSGVQASLAKDAANVRGQESFRYFLPVINDRVLNDAPPCGSYNSYCEDYDDRNNSYGPLKAGQIYQAYPEDTNDYYFIILTEPGIIKVQVTNYQAIGQVILYDAAMKYIAHYGGGGSTMVIGPLSVPAGKYFIRVYTSQNTNSTSLYSLIWNK